MRQWLVYALGSRLRCSPEWRSRHWVGRRSRSTGRRLVLSASGATRTVGDGAGPGTMPFSSTENLLGDGSTGRQIFVWRHFNWVCQNGKPTAPTAAMCPNPPEPFLYRVTNGPGSPDHPSVSDTFETNGTFPQPPLAQWVAFEADGSYNGSTGCEASRRQIFLFEVYSKELRQITFGCDGDSTNPTLSFHAGLLAFESTASGIAPGAVSPPGVKQMQHLLPQRPRDPEGDGGRGRQLVPHGQQGRHAGDLPVLVRSARDAAGHRHPAGFFWSEYDRHRHRHTIHQLTNGNADSEHPYNAEDRPFVAFESEATDLPGELCAGRPADLHRPRRYRAGGRSAAGHAADQPDAVRPVHLAGGRPGQLPRRVHLHAGPHAARHPGNRVYTFDLEEGRLYQVSAASDVTGPIGFNHGPWFVSLVTSADLNGTGTCGRRLWLVDYFAGPQDGNSKIGVRRFAVQPGDAVNGSEGQLVTKDGTLIGDVRTPRLHRHAVRVAGPRRPRPGHPRRNDRHHPDGYAHLPPIPFPVSAPSASSRRAPVAATLDCDGGKPGSHVSIRQDHFTDDEDPSCIRPGACREDDPDCHG